MGKKAPLTTAFEDVEDGVQDLTKIVSPRPSTAIGGGQVRLDVIPFGIGKIGSTVRLSQTLRERGLLLAQSAPHGKTKAQTPNRNSSLSLQRLPPLRQKRTRKSQRA